MLRILTTNRSFRSLWFGQLISALGDRLTQMGILTFVMITAQDKGDKVALITFFSLLPFLLFGPLFGALVDRYSRKQLMIFADITRAAMVALIPIIWINTHSLHLIVIWFFVLGTLTALFSPAKMSIITNITDKDALLEANSMIVTTGMVATLVGTLIAGAIIKVTGVQPAFYINGLTYVISALFIMRITYQKSSQRIYTFERIYSTLLDDIKVGIGYIRRHQVIFQLILLSSIFSFFSSFAYILILNYGSTVLKQGPFGIGCLLSSAGFGMIIGSAILIKRKDKVNYGKTLFISYAIVGICCLLLFLRPTLHPTLAILFCAGIGAATLTITLDTVFQRVTPDELKGKIFSTRGVVSNSVFLICLLLVGYLIRRIHVTALFALVGIVGIIVAGRIVVYEKRWGYQLLRLFLRFLMRAYFWFRISGLENLPRTRRVILAGNHTSIIDGIAVMCAYPGRIYFLVAETVFRTWPWGWIVKRLGYIPVKREGFNKEAIKETVAILKLGYSIGIFPEGKITADGRLTKGKEGVVLIARLANMDIIPFAIEGAYEAWHLLKGFPKRFPISVHFGKPIDIKEYVVQEELVEEVMREIAKAKLYLEREGYLRVEPDEIIKHLINIG